MATMDGFTYRNLKPLQPGNIAKSATLETYPAWSFGLKRGPDDDTSGPGPAYLADNCAPWDRGSYKFGSRHASLGDTNKYTNGPYYNYDTDCIAAKKLTGGWRPEGPKNQKPTPGPQDYNAMAGFEASRGRGKPFNMAPTWGPPPTVLRPDRMNIGTPDPGYTDRWAQTYRPSTVMGTSSTRVPPKYMPSTEPQPTPGPADYVTTKQYKFGDKYHGYSMGRRFADKKPNGFPASADYPVEQSTIGAATRRGFKPM